MIDRIRIKGREFLNPYLGPLRRKLVQIRESSLNFTIISNNCWGGHVYRYFNLPYDSPTIGLYFFTEDYLKFISNMKAYLEKELNFITYSESKYKFILEERGGKNISCPIARLGDVEIIFLHYNSIEEAREKWNRRKVRIHWDNMYFKMSQQNLCSENDVVTFDTLPYANKLIFTTQDYGIKSQVIFGDWFHCENVNDDTTHFRRFVNLINLFSNKPFKKKQSKYLNDIN